MHRYRLKIVRDTHPNEDGRWIEHYSKAPVTFETVVKEGYHVVKIETLPPAPQDQPFYMHSSLGERDR